MYGLSVKRIPLILRSLLSSLRSGRWAMDERLLGEAEKEHSAFAGSIETFADLTETSAGLPVVIRKSVCSS